MNGIRRLPLELPGRTVRLYARYWLPLLVWYLLGRGLHDILVEVGAHVNRHNAVLAYSLLAMAVLCLIASFVMMFHTVQPALPTLAGLKGQGHRGLREHLRALGLAMLPFLLIYSAWGEFENDVRRMEYRTWEINPLEPTPGRSEFTLWFAGAAVVAYIIVKILEAIIRRTLNPVAGLLAAVFEALWMFFGVFGIRTLLEVGFLRLQNTLAWHNFAELWRIGDGIGPVLPIRFHDVLDLSFGWLGFAAEPLFTGIALPLAWLAICASCYGREMENVKEIVDHRRFARLVERTAGKAPGVLQRHGKRFPPASFREKYYPPLHAIWLMLSASVPAVLFFFVLYSALELLGALFNQGLATIIGPHNAGSFWSDVEPIMTKAVDAVTEPLRICLLAVAVDYGLSRYTAARESTATRPAEPSAQQRGQVPAASTPQA